MRRIPPLPSRTHGDHAGSRLSLDLGIGELLLHRLHLLLHFLRLLEHSRQILHRSFIPS